MTGPRCTSDILQATKTFPLKTSFHKNLALCKVQFHTFSKHLLRISDSVMILIASNFFCFSLGDEYSSVVPCPGDTYSTL